jgi:predicted enzyme related to lactoylglutathione lyase
MNDLVVWFDIPVEDMERAVSFYERLTEQTLRRMNVGPDKETALFESDGCLFKAPETSRRTSGRASTSAQRRASTCGLNG